MMLRIVFKEITIHSFYLLKKFRNGEFCAVSEGNMVIHLKAS